jgi:arsenical pump membrane protein
MAGLAHAAGQVWPAFALVTGLLLVGVVAERDGLFASAGAALARVPGGARTVYLVALALVTVVTAVLNLDTSVFFLTPVLLHLARTRGLDEAPFLYGAVFMSNASSLYLPGSNLTNLIVLHGQHVNGADFLAHMWGAALAATVVTALLLVLLFRRELAGAGAGAQELPPLRLWIGAAAVLAATVLVLVLRAPALPVLGVGIVAVLLDRAPWRRVAEVLDLRVLLGLLALAILLGGLGRAWHGPADYVNGLGGFATAVAGALTAVAVNNLPAAVLLTPVPPAHGHELLLGLNLGPNLAVTGSLSAFLWLRVARAFDARPSALRYSRLGVVLVPLSLAAAYAAFRL